jgi:tRNA-splicing ligase RtcB (3'-phosphate/5'-hydroxy nucleic acid ligase)
MNISGNHLKELGFTEGKALGIALQLLRNDLADYTLDEKFLMLKEVLYDPQRFINNNVMSALAAELLRPVDDTIALVNEHRSFQIYGAEGIEHGALRQMEIAMKLPVTVAGALMPDAHQGYGLPIGGVLATNDAVIPYAVGVDIGCRMCMTIYDIPVSVLEEKLSDLRKLLLNNTRFGVATFNKPLDHEIFQRKEFSEIAVVREMKDRAWQQIGTSGGGNHFVEFCVAEIEHSPDNLLAPGQYVALLSHSGSRGLGANIARHYTHVAMEKCKLPPEAKNLAWLDLNTEEGQEYWMAMNLAGDYASACHHQIHERLARALGESPLIMIENHHNFAWKESDVNGNEVIVHRKGATPAGKGVLGIIPGSMATPGFIVRGKGVAASVNSASHGAGRTMSRTKAKETITKGHVSKFLKAAGVELIGSGVDEAPMVYKDIHQVMNSQRDLVDVLGTFMPKIVRMCGDEKFNEAD